MKQFIILTITLTLSSTLFSQHPLPGDTLFVWARDGLNLRAGTDLEQDVIIAIPAGEAVRFIKTTPDRPQIMAIPYHRSLNQNLVLTGNWVMVEYGSYRGFVFDAYLLPFPPGAHRTLEEYVYSNASSCDTLYFDDNCAGGECLRYKAKGAVSEDITFQVNETGLGLEWEFKFNRWTIQEAFVFMNFFIQIDKKDLNGHLPTVLQSQMTSWKILNSNICHFNLDCVRHSIVVVYHCSC